MVARPQMRTALAAMLGGASLLLAGAAVGQTTADETPVLPLEPVITGSMAADALTAEVDTGAGPLMTSDLTIAERPRAKPVLQIDLSTAAQGVPVLVLDPDELFSNSAWGRRMQAELNEIGQQISVENARLEAQFKAEEAALSEARATMTPEEFRDAATDFDARAQEVRRERANALLQLQQRADREKEAFLEGALPVLAGLMEERGVSVVLDRRVVFLAAGAVDVTRDLVGQVDKALGDGAGQVAGKAARGDAAPAASESSTSDAAPAEAAAEN